MKLNVHSPLNFLVILLLLISCGLQASGGPQQGKGKDKVTKEELEDRLDQLRDELQKEKTKFTDQQQQWNNQSTAQAEKLKKAKEKKEKLEKEFRSQPKQSFHTQHAAPAAGTETDHAQAEYFIAQANSIKSNDAYRVGKDVAIVVSRDYVAPAVQPVITELRQKAYKTEHETRMEEKEKLELERTKQGLKTEKSSEFNTKVNTLVTLMQASPDPKKKDLANKAFEALEKSFLADIEDKSITGESKDQNDNKNQTTSITEPSINNDATSSTEKPSDSQNPSQQNPTTTNKEDAKQINKGMIARIGAFIFPPVVVHGMDIVAKHCGAQKLAQILSSSVPMLQGKEEFISRSLVFAGTTATLMALYEIYKALSGEEDKEEDELDFFEKNGFGGQMSYK